MIRIQNLNQYYGQSHTLRDMDMTIETGKCTVLMGRNGVGKTTLLQCIMGVLPLKSGSVSLYDSNLSARRSSDRARLGIGYVPQGRQIFPLLTVQENLEIGLPIRLRADRKIPPLIFDLFPVLKDMLQRRGGDLSGGQQQQLAIARALVIDPKILILDEPTEGIQPNIVQHISDIIRTLNKEFHMTVLLVEQKLPFARRVGDSFIIIDRGAVMATGDMSVLDDKTVQKYLSV